MHRRCHRNERAQAEQAWYPDAHVGAKPLWTYLCSRATTRRRDYFGRVARLGEKEKLKRYGSLFEAARSQMINDDAR
ncbi:MAG: hypothetical protein L0Y42_12165 [Phycisphaerales bacterium]|nr:hypothetical protein [Phycisphaerales bacterium]